MIPLERVLASRWVRAAALLFVIAPLVTDLFYAAFLPRTRLRGLDLHVYLAGAAVGMRNGWPHLYDANLQRPLIQPLFSHLAGFHPGYWTPYVTPPPVAWLLSPVAGVPFDVLWVLWTLVMSGCVLAAALLVAQANLRSRVLMCMLLLAMPNVVLGVVFGNIWALQLLAIAGGWRVARGQRHLAAGLVLGVTVLKPQVVLLVLPALLVAGYWRIAGGYLIVALGLALLSFALLGASGVSAWLHLLSFVSSFPDERTASLMRLLAPQWLAFMLPAAGALAAMAVAFVYRREGAGIPLAAGVIGSLLVAPYMNGYDFILAALAGVIVVREQPEPLVALAGWLLAASGVVAGSGAALAAPAAAAFVALVTLLLVRSRSLGSGAVRRPGQEAGSLNVSIDGWVRFVPAPPVDWRSRTGQPRSKPRRDRYGLE